jgi:hypothetical protein
MEIFCVCLRAGLLDLGILRWPIRRRRDLCDSIGMRDICRSKRFIQTTAVLRG